MRLLAYIEDEGHVVEIELALLFVELLELCCVVILTLLCYVCPHVSLLLGLLNICLCGVDVLIGLLCVLRGTLFEVRRYGSIHPLHPIAP